MRGDVRSRCPWSELGETRPYLPLRLSGGRARGAPRPRPSPRHSAVTGGARLSSSLLSGHVGLGVCGRDQAPRDPTSQLPLATVGPLGDHTGTASRATHPSLEGGPARPFRHGVWRRGGGSGARGRCSAAGAGVAHLDTLLQCYSVRGPRRHTGLRSPQLTSPKTPVALCPLTQPSSGGRCGLVMWFPWEPAEKRCSEALCTGTEP